MKLGVFASSLVIAAALAGEARAADFVPSPTRVHLSLAFSHWIGKTFVAPDGFKTPAITLGVRPRRSWLELQGRYVVSLVGLPLPSGRTGNVGFASIAALGSHELGFGRQSLNGFAGPEISLAHTPDGVGWGVGLVLGLQWMMRTGWAHNHSMGGFFATHVVVYALPGDHGIFKDPRRDAHIDLGVVTTLF